MREYLLIATSASLVAAFCIGLSHDSYKKATETAAGVILTAIIIAPLLSAGASFMEGFDGFVNIPQESEKNGYSEAAKLAFEKGIRKAISDNFAVREDEITLLVEDFDFEKMRAQGMKVTLVGSAAFGNTRGIKRYVEKNFLLEGGKCEVGVELK